jgi:hypothetical protein
MLKKLLVVAAVLVALFAGLETWRFRALARPKAEPWHFVEPVIALGTITTDQVVPVTYDLKNETDADIKIVTADGSCRCITLESGPDVIPAHGMGTFKFIFVAARSLGAETHDVTIEAADGRTINGTFTVTVIEAAPPAGSGKPGS